MGLFHKHRWFENHVRSLGFPLFASDNMEMSGREDNKFQSLVIQRWFQTYMHLDTLSLSDPFP
jgi:hypothetical protein